MVHCPLQFSIAYVFNCTVRYKCLCKNNIQDNLPCNSWYLKLKLQDSVGARLYCPHTLSDNN